METTTTPSVNKVVWLENGNIWINGKEMTPAAYLNMTQRQRDKLAGEYAARIGK